uniref:Uncharacterized protein n=1 Tax=Rhizophora mucronata TaxID=61149 RepID=A0A2P2P8H9_RHIMU
MLRFALPCFFSLLHSFL